MLEQRYTQKTSSPTSEKMNPKFNRMTESMT